MMPTSMAVETRRIGDWDVTARCAPGQEPLARDVLETLARLAAREALRDGLRVRFGWSLLTLREQAPGTLTVCEPDFAGDPLRAVRPGVETTLDVLRRQAALLRRVGAPPADVRFDQSVIVRRGAFDRGDVQLLREAPVGSDDSGWRVVRVDLPHSRAAEDFELMLVSSLLASCPAALAGLALPTGYAVSVSSGRIVAVMDPQGEDRLA